MRLSDQSRERRELHRFLERWRTVVERHARGLRSDPGKYAVLYGEVVRRCRGLAAAAGEEHKALYEDVEKLLQPWLTSEALTRAEKDILIEVSQRCRQAERSLDGRPWLRAGRRWARPVLKTLFIGALAGVLGWAWHQWGQLLQSTYKGARFEITMALGRLGVGERWILGGAIVIAIAILVLSRTAKN
jgi:hypothetical protein